jgi:hypothetical protein
MQRQALLRAAIENNIDWCSTVCSAHGCDERELEWVWMNLAPSPRYYPNIITKRPRSNEEVALRVGELRRAGLRGNWGIKDSFGDLDLSEAGFTSVLAGRWWGCPHQPPRAPATLGWQAVAGGQSLMLWEEAWGGDPQARIFKDSLLNSGSVTFWALHRDGGVEAGCISSVSKTSAGLSNWFSRSGKSALDLGIVEAIREKHRNLPLVLWACNEDDLLVAAGLDPLGPLQVWINQDEG